MLAARLDDILGMQTRRQTGALPPDAIVGLCRHWQAIERLARDGAPKGAMQGPSAGLASDEERGAISRAARTVLWAAASQHWQLLTGLARAARARAARIEARVKAARLRDWCAWLGCGAGSTPPRLTRSGYRWVKGTCGWTRSPVGDAVRNDDASVAAPHLVGDDDDPPKPFDDADLCAGLDDGEKLHVPMCDQAAVDLEGEEWATQWNVGAEYQPLPFGDENGQQPSPDLAADMMREAAASFPATTGVGSDNVGPRACSRLSDAALGALAAILMACERTGCWPIDLWVVLIVLLPKPDGGLRPIGLFPTPVRIWMRARAWIAQAWEAAHASPRLFGGKGMGAQRAAWTAAFQAEAAALDTMSHAVALLDLVKAFERIPHWHLVQAALRHGYPIVLLRLSLAAYRIRRAVGVAGVFSCTLIATRGITVGSGFATTELRLLLGTVVAVASRWWRLADLKLYVDDLTIAATAKRDAAVGIVAGIVDFVVRHFEVHLELEVSATKSIAIGSDVATARSLYARTATTKLCPKRASKMLGAPSGG